jgi:hypothetical protein
LLPKRAHSLSVAVTRTE